jgi:hypothetical protein
MLCAGTRVWFHLVSSGSSPADQATDTLWQRGGGSAEDGPNPYLLLMGPPSLTLSLRTPTAPPGPSEWRGWPGSVPLAIEGGEC